MAFGGRFSDEAIFYRGRASDYSVRYLSNWHLLSQPILFHGKEFSSTEHLYKWTKAKFFSDEAAALQVLSTEHPSQLSALCTYPRTEQFSALNRKLDQLKRRIMIVITTIKFGSDESLLQSLLSTGDRSLVEDTSDECWGRGRMGRGQNLHGECLMEVRRQYQTDVEQPSTLVVGDSLTRNIAIHGATTLCMGGARAGQVCLLAELFSLVGIFRLIIHVGTKRTMRSHAQRLQWVTNFDLVNHRNR